jgi:NCAIR mutase (PurE)-related protein
MAALYPIKFSTNKKIHEVPNKEGKIEKKTLKDLEKLVLQNMFRFARKVSKNIDEGFLITDCLDQLKNLTGKELDIKFTEEDIKFLKIGYSVAGTSDLDYINTWFDSCRDLLIQIKDPKSTEQLKKEEKKK